MPKLVKNQPERFTILNNEIFSDRKLGGMERGVLCTMLSLPDNWNFSIKGLAAILPDGETKIRTALKKLEKAGYLIRRRIYKDGKIVDWEYIISDRPMLLPDDTEDSKDETAESNEDSNTFLSAANLDVVNLDVENLHQDIQVVENPHDYKESRDKTPKNKKTSDKKSINLSAQQPAASTIDRIDRTSEQKSAERLMTEGYIKGQIEYEWYEEFFEETPNNSADRNENTTFAANIGEVDMLVAIIVSVISSNKEYIRIGGQEIPHSVVKSRFMKLEQKHIEYVLKCLMLSTKDIRNPTAYITTALYNATLTCDFAENNELKNLDPAMFIPEQYHDEAFRDRHYEHTAFRPKT